LVGLRHIRRQNNCSRSVSRSVVDVLLLGSLRVTFPSPASWGA
jgi:hypothetical protein